MPKWRRNRGAAGQRHRSLRCVRRCRPRSQWGSPPGWYARPAVYATLYATSVRDHGLQAEFLRGFESSIAH